MPVNDPEKRRRRRDHDHETTPKSGHKHSSTGRTGSRRRSGTPTKDKDRDKDREREREKRKEKLMSDRERDSPLGSDRSYKKNTVPEMERRPSTVSLDDTKTAYPSFSKAHSKEFVGSRENVASPSPRVSLFTPDPTEMNGKSPLKARFETTRTQGAPPSPPLTAQETDLRRSKSGYSMRTDLRSTQEHGRLRSTSYDGRSSVPERTRSSSSMHDKKTKQETTAQKAKFAPMESQYEIVSDTGSPNTSTISRKTFDSQATSVARCPVPTATQAQVQDTRHSPRTASDSSPRTPTATHPPFSSIPDGKQTPGVLMMDDNMTPRYNTPFSGVNTPFQNDQFAMPPPPPPPPPPAMRVSDPPRVDYLLYNGGLPQTLSRTFLAAPYANTHPNVFQGPGQPRMTGVNAIDAAKIFQPFHTLLNDFSQVIAKNGSIAVATGYKSVARRLLGRLEAVFNRNISSEVCECVMCLNDTSDTQQDEDNGLSWGEILEYVSGRRVLPQWPPFNLTTEAAIAASDIEAPMQKLDVDVPDEYRDHYIRQSKKTKQVVQAWLEMQPEAGTSPPQEADDETLIFAMITHLEPQKRRVFAALVRGLSSVPDSRAPTPGERMKSELISKTALAIQRLYRLRSTPRDAECALFLLQNAPLHGVLATVAAISQQEWDILTSGRFDGFLWSGADDPQSPNFVPLMSSRTTTPFSPPSTSGTPFTPGGIRRGQTPAPASGGAPVQLDEDTEIAALAEVEREIYAGMESLEDAFERLHTQAEQVRHELQQRCAGLSMAASARRGSANEQPEIRGATPGIPGAGGIWAGAWEGEDDEFYAASELGPDDSASNISHGHSRRRRIQRDIRRELKTPVTVAEEDEEEDEEEEDIEPIVVVGSKKKTRSSKLR